LRVVALIRRPDLVQRLPVHDDWSYLLGSLAYLGKLKVLVRRCEDVLDVRRAVLVVSMFQMVHIGVISFFHSAEERIMRRPIRSEFNCGIVMARAKRSYLLRILLQGWSVWGLGVDRIKVSSPVMPNSSCILKPFIGLLYSFIAWLMVIIFNSRLPCISLRSSSRVSFITVNTICIIVAALLSNSIDLL
jgi:hypothetical protein